CDVDASLETEPGDAVEDELDLEGPELCGVVQVDVDANAGIGRERHHRIDLSYRVAIDRGGVESAHPADGFAGSGLAQQLEHAGSSQHAVLRECHDLHV